MKSFLGLVVVACVALVVSGCSEPADTAVDKTKTTAAVSSPLDADLCGKCGCCAGCDDCCQGEKCDCGMQKGSELCCSGVKPSDVVYCKSCGFGKGTDQCCSEDNEACSCGLAKGSPLCCKIKGDDEHAEGSHEGDSDAGHKEGHDEHEGHDED